jgi:hypothetical protein
MTSPAASAGSSATRVFYATPLINKKHFDIGWVNLFFIDNNFLSAPKSACPGG